MRCQGMLLDVMFAFFEGSRDGGIDDGSGAVTLSLLELA